MEREKLRIQANSHNNDTMVVEPGGGYRRTWGGKQGFRTSALRNMNKKTFRITGSVAEKY